MLSTLGRIGKHDFLDFLQILERLKNGEEMFIILNEIQKGTNSMDKQKGSLALVKQLLQLKTNGIIATHDLLLGDLKQHFPKEISNYCFEANIQNDELSFSYKLREGVAQNMNACFLMQKMGIVISWKADFSTKNKAINKIMCIFAYSIEK